MKKTTNTKAYRVNLSIHSANTIVHVQTFLSLKNKKRATQENTIDYIIKMHTLEKIRA